MDDSCAVCAETLEWVAYGACGHREVCSTCVARLRFICNDRRCCICKTESNVVFVTKALGDYTRMISDFAVLPSELREGRVGSYWYHEDMQAFFDDLDHYKMIKAMCRLSCSVCDKMDEHSNDASKRRGRFRNIDQLKGHLFHQHNLRMCSLCLQGRKVFICEQKLYTRAQLNQHINTGDSEVDGTESERGGFMGHPLCEFCRTPFYGDNELYSHMSTEHYTCHICQRQHPGQYEYYKNYDDLEIHFRREHFLCEDEACLGKKFVVFQSEAEIKRHNAMEHGGRMSRSKRNAVLQIPTSFRYQRSNEQDNRRGRGRGRTFHRDYSEDQLSMAIEASYEMANADGTFHDPSSFRTQIVSDHGETSDIDPIIQPFESFGTTDSEPSRYLQALSQNSRNAPIVESSFPPLPMAPASSQQKPKHEPEVLPRNTMATHLRRQTNRNVTLPNSAQAWPAASRAPVLPATDPIHTWPTESGAAGLSSSSGHTKAKTDYGPAPFSYSSLAQAQPAAVHEPSPAGFSSSRKMGSTSRIIHSTSAPNLADSSSFDLSDSGFPPVSATQVRKLPTSGQSKLKVEDVHTANKSLVERIRSALDFDEAKYSAFKDISGEYRQGLMDAETYVGYVNQFGLSHLVIELARLCPDAEKQRALVETYDATLRNNGPQENGWSKDSSRMKDGNGSKKGKGKCLDAEDNSSNNNLVDSVIDTLQKLQSSYKPSEEEVVEVLSKDGYRAAKGKSKVEVNKPQAEMSSLSQPSAKLKGENDCGSVGVGSNQNLGDAGGKSKQRKKTSKFHRVRLGDGSVAALLDLKYSDPDPDPDVTEAASDASKNPSEGLPVRGVWQKGGGQRLLAMTARDSKK